MPGFFFRPVDLATLALFVVAMMKSWRLWRLQPATPASRWLAFASSWVVLFALLSIAASARLDAWSFYAIHLRVITTALAGLSFLQYTYSIGELDPSGREARWALAVNLLAVAAIAGLAATRIMQFTTQGSAVVELLPSRVSIGLFAVWALVVAARQTQRARHAKDKQLVNFLIVLLLGIVVLIAANILGLFSAAGQVGDMGEILPIYLLAVGFMLISFSFFLFSDTDHSRFNRVVSVSLLVLQSVFSLMAAVFGWLISASIPTVSASAGSSFIVYRAAVNGWIEPLFIFQSVVSLFSIVLLYFLEGYLHAQDQRRITQTLNRRQIDIARLVAAGKSNADIAHELHITQATVKYHLTHIFQTLNLNSRRSLAIWYREITEK